MLRPDGPDRTSARSISASAAIVIEPKIALDRVLFLLSYCPLPPTWRPEQPRLAAARRGWSRRRASRRSLARRAEAFGWASAGLPDGGGDAADRARSPPLRRPAARRFGRLPPVEVAFRRVHRGHRGEPAAQGSVGRARTAARSAATTTRRPLGRPRAGPERVRQPSSLRLAPPAGDPLHAAQRALPADRSSWRGSSFGRPRSISARERAASAFLIDMNRVFEDFVVAALREALGLTERTLPAQGRAVTRSIEAGTRPAEAGHLLVGGRPAACFVGDVKYKRTELAGSTPTSTNSSRTSWQPG